MKKIIALLMVFALAFALCACGGAKEAPAVAKEAPAVAKETPAVAKETPAVIIDNNGNTVEMTHEELIQVYKDNQLKFENLYGAAEITFVGTVKNIKSEIYAAATGVLSNICWDEIYFEEGWKVLVHHGSYDDILMELSPGDKLQVESQIYHAFINVEVTGCSEYGVKGNEGLKTPVLTIVK